jgi:hypothetical protein
MAPARRQGVRYSAEVWKEVVRAVDATEERSRGQENHVDGTGCVAALAVRRSCQSAYPIYKRLRQVLSMVWRRYGTRGRKWVSGNLRLGSAEHVTGWSVTHLPHPVSVM